MIIVAIMAVIVAFILAQTRGVGTFMPSATTSKRLAWWVSGSTGCSSASTR